MTAISLSGFESGGGGKQGVAAVSADQTPISVCINRQADPNGLGIGEETDALDLRAAREFAQTTRVGARDLYNAYLFRDAVADGFSRVYVRLPGGGKEYLFVKNDGAYSGAK